MPIYYWIILGISVIFSIFFSSADMVYSVVDKDILKDRADNGSKSAKLAYKLANDYESSIASILFGNNVFNILATSIVTIIGTRWNENWGVSVATVIFTIFIIIFAEFIPKAFSKHFSLKLSLVYAYPVEIFKILTFVIVWPLSKPFILIKKLFEKRSIEEDIVDGDVLNEMVDSIEESGQLDENEADIVRGAIDISETQAFEIMTPRVDVFAIDVEDDINEIIEEGELFKYSRIPVYEETIDNIIGVVPVDAIAKAMFKNEEINIRELMYKPLAIPRNHDVLDLLDEFKTSKIHIAIVIDEYGGTDGIVTMEDILEEIVGDIFDETDDVEEEFIDQGNGVYIVDGSMDLEDFFDLIEYKEEFKTDYSTVAGFCQEILNRFAITGDEFTFADKYECKVLQADEFTVEKLEVKNVEYEEEQD